MPAKSRTVKAPKKRPARKSTGKSSKLVDKTVDKAKARVKVEVKVLPSTKTTVAPKSGKVAPKKRAGSKGTVRKKARRARISRSKLSASEIEAMFAAFQADTPEPKGELDFTNPYTLLVAVALSAQATDVGVNRATRKLFRLADTPEKMLKLGEDEVREHIKTVGLFRNKAKNVIAMSKILVENHDSEVPRTREALELLPGVGRKTANVVLNIAFGEPTIAVDTHLFRISNRTGLAPGKDPLAVELSLLKTVPDAYLLHAHHWLILHGRYICVARKPKCPLCIVRDYCKWKEKTEPA